MALSVHVNGEASIKTGTGSAGALEQLGISVDGVSISAKVLYKDVKIDTYGDVPFDKIYSGSWFEISAELVYYDEAVLEKVLTTLFAGNTFGLMGAVGSLMVQDGKTQRLLIESPKDGVVYNFPKAFLIDSDDFKRGTSQTIHNLKWYAIAAQQTGTSLNAVICNSSSS